MTGQANATPAWFAEALAVAPETLRLVMDGAVIHALAWGRPDGRPVILVHGNSAHARWWSHVAPLMREGRRVVAIDLGGMGDSGERTSYTPAGFAAEIDTLARHLAAATGHDRVDVVAHSFGGLVSTWWAASLPSVDGRLVLIDVPFMDSGYRPSHRRNAYRAPLFPDRETAIGRFRLLPDQPCANDYIVEYVAANSVTRTEGGWTWKFRANPWSYSAFQGDFWDRLADAAGRIDRPVTILRGEASALCGPAMEDRWRAVFRPGVNIRVVPGAHHHIMLDTPRELADLLDRILA